VFFAFCNEGRRIAARIAIIDIAIKSSSNVKISFFRFFMMPFAIF